MLIGKRNNNLLWDIQASLCVLYVMGGVTKTFMLDKIAGRPPRQRPYLTAFVMAASIFELLCGVALIARPAVEIQSSLTPVAATCLAVEGAQVRSAARYVW
jgi:uncharacterized membrane protein